MRKENPTERVDKSKHGNKQASEKEAASDDVHSRECIGIMLRDAPTVSKGIALNNTGIRLYRA
jgi:hypothetical protein